ncbi:phospholipid carrier-dependent glycosyltransferase [Patescibacteria group bacterium]|nr:MAG: phospholipid carrier-dependent glycosyltransferase [Patescibacteria group bacterium]
MIRRLREALIHLPTWVYLVTAVAAIPRFYNITKASIWHDEGYTMMLAPMGVVEILERTARDVHPPLYYVTLHYWMFLFGTSELAARSLSAVCLLLAIPLTYLLMRRLFHSRAAAIATLLVAFSPFLIRYSQEARMYGMVALLLLFATYSLVRALQDKQKLWWVLYALAIAAGLYTHYYAVFLIAAHWVYVTSLTNSKPNSGLKNRWWWGSNVLAAGLFALWLPVAYAQFSRVQGGFWIQEPTLSTLPNTILQFLVFSPVDWLPVWIKVAVGLTLVAATIALWVTAKKHRSATVLVAAYALVAPLTVFALSFGRPIYIDRYFVFASIGFCCLVAAIVVHGWLLSNRPRVQNALVGGLLILSVIGIGSVYSQATHQMREVGKLVSTNYVPGDEIVSGELYTFFDFSYYNTTTIPTKLYAQNGVNGYGESSLIYDRADQIVVKDLSTLRPASGYVWMIGKSGDGKSYFEQVPANWQTVGPRYQFRDSAVQRFKVN